MPPNFLSFFTAALIATAGTASAEPVVWSASDSWDIAYYPGSSGCQAFALFGKETAFFIGYDGKGNRPALDVTVLNKGWDMIEDGGEYPVRLRFGEQAAWTLNMDGMILNGYPGLHILIDAQTPSARLFTREFKRELKMTWQLKDQPLGTFALTGSNHAFKEVTICHDFHRKARATDAVSSPKTADPFAD